MVNMAQTIMFKCKFELFKHTAGWSIEGIKESDDFLKLIQANQVGQEEIEDKTKYIFCDNSIIIEHFDRDHGPTFNHYDEDQI